MSRLNSYAAECYLSREAAKLKGCKSATFTTQQLLEVANSCPTGRERLSLAQPYLTNEYGAVENAPESVILDYVFGLDCVFMWRGWCIGIDATTNPNAIASKTSKMRYLQPLYEKLGIDKWAICFSSLREAMPTRRFTNVTVADEGSSNLKAALSTAIKGDIVINL